MTTVERISVRHIAAMLSESYESPADLAAAVLDKIPDRDLRAAMGEVLPQYVSAYVSRQRNSAISSRSAKVDGIRDWYNKFLSQPLHTETGWRRIGQCSVDDLLFAASERRDRAASEMVRADQYERLAAAVRKSGKSTVSALAEAVVRAALDGAK